MVDRFHPRETSSGNTISHSVISWRYVLICPLGDEHTHVLLHSLTEVCFASHHIAPHLNCLHRFSREDQLAKNQRKGQKERQHFAFREAAIDIDTHRLHEFQKTVPIGLRRHKIESSQQKQIPVELGRFPANTRFPDFPDSRSISSKVSISGSGILNPYFSCDNFSHSVSEHQEE